jgi:hypothetical protein
MYELGECNTFLDYFWADFTENKGVAAYDGEALDFNEKLSAALAEGYYHWYGSLTTPPCTEGVSWNLLKVRQTVCQRQVDTLKAALGATQHGLEFNNRVPQPLNHRVVRLNGAIEAEPTAAPTTSVDAGPETETSAAPTGVSLPPCSEISDPFQPCAPETNVESGAVAAILTLLALAHIA